VAAASAAAAPVSRNPPGGRAPAAGRRCRRPGARPRRRTPNGAVGRGRRGGRTPSGCTRRRWRRRR